MILAAALLVLVALGLFVWGVLSGVTALYWACVVVSAVAAVLLIIARRRLGREEPPATRTTAQPGAEPVAAEPVAAEPVAAHHAEPPAEEPPAGEPVADGGIPASRHGHRVAADGAEESVRAADGGDVATAEQEPPVEEVEVSDLLLVVDLTDEVLVIDEHPRYHLAGCTYLRGHTPIPLPLDEARTDGFTPCARCAPDRHLAERERGRRAQG